MVEKLCGKGLVNFLEIYELLFYVNRRLVLELMLLIFKLCKINKGSCNDIIFYVIRILCF